MDGVGVADLETDAGRLLLEITVTAGDNIFGMLFANNIGTKESVSLHSLSWPTHARAMPALCLRCRLLQFPMVIPNTLPNALQRSTCRAFPLE